MEPTLEVDLSQVTIEDAEVSACLSDLVDSGWNPELNRCYQATLRTAQAGVQRAAVVFKDCEGQLFSYYQQNLSRVRDHPFLALFVAPLLGWARVTRRRSAELLLVFDAESSEPLRPLESEDARRAAARGLTHLTLVCYVGECINRRALLANMWRREMRGTYGFQIIDSSDITVLKAGVHEVATYPCAEFYCSRQRPIRRAPECENLNWCDGWTLNGMLYSAAAEALRTLVSDDQGEAVLSPASITAFRTGALANAAGGAGVMARNCAQPELAETLTAMLDEIAESRQRGVALWLARKDSAGPASEAPIEAESKSEPPTNPVCDILMSASTAIMRLDIKGFDVYIDHCEAACQAYLELKRVISAYLSQPKPCSTVIVGPTRQAALFAQAVSARVGVTKVLHLPRPTKALFEAACDLADSRLLILVTMDPTSEAAAIALGKCVRDAPRPHLFVFLTADGKLADSIQPLTRLDIPMPSQDIDLTMLVEQSDLLSFAEI